MKKKICNVLVGTLVTSMMSNMVTISNVYADSNIEFMKETSEDWNYETHEPGWVNNELQEYTDSTDNIYVKDGELVLKAIQEKNENGTKYTSIQFSSWWKLAR